MKKLSATLVMSAVTVALTACSTMTSRTPTTVPSGPTQVTAEGGVIPAGTTVAVRTDEKISSKQAGQTFSGQVAENIEDQSGKILVPRGSPAELVVLQASSGGTVGTPKLALGVRSITVNGKRHTVSTAATEQRGEEGIGANRRTAEMVGGGAVLGTLIGAAAGGGKGAAIGAVAGAAAGAATQVITNGDKVEVPAETILTFRLSQPWQLNA